ncbi:ribosome maturation factor RimM [Prevotella histicola]|jgi:16S rRNA processing protein rimM|uniref:ribosome maturation factor RimM n=1 Tax=Prevotella histicola TaxID=470565 RepID=UPI0028E189C8|nr:ribosome maturation factor RimM [Prevotella histicola]
MIKKEDVYKIGRIGKPHGVHGEVQMQYSDDVFDVVDADYLLLNVDGILVPFFMEEYRFRSDEIVLMKFCDINTEAQARELTGSEVYFPRKLAEEGTNELSWAQIVGYSLIDNTTKKDVGTIVAVDETTVNTLFEVNSPEGDELLIPASNELITAINSEEKTITINIPEGLLDL